MREEERWLPAADGVAINAAHRPASDPVTHLGGAGVSLGFVVAHGFTGSRLRPEVVGIVDVLTRHGGVVSFDFRGHGRSAGASTVGRDEVLDLAAAVCWARELGYRAVVTIGWSMGAAVAVRQAGLARRAGAGPHVPDAVVAVSGPSRWNYRGTAPMRLVHRGIGTRAGRAVLARRYRTRVAPGGWRRWPEAPDVLAASVAPVPLLIVHGDADHYLPLEHARWLQRSARGCALWVVPGFTHAEGGVDPGLLARIAGWASAAAEASARMPG